MIYDIEDYMILIKKPSSTLAAWLRDEDCFRNFSRLLLFGKAENHQSNKHHPEVMARLKSGKNRPRGTPYSAQRHLSILFLLSRLLESLSTPGWWLRPFHAKCTDVYQYFYYIIFFIKIK